MAESVGIGIFFFFQAEDGIRDGRVTGVQTCALPISAVATAATRAGPAAASHALLAANTNLERISDWLTTLLIGATLVQVKEIGRASCRERGVGVGGGGIVKKKKKERAREDEHTMKIC